MNFLRGQHISFVVLSCGLRETSIGVDYTERRKTAREKSFCMFSPLHHRATTEREEILREIKMKRFINFYYATMKFLRG